MTTWILGLGVAACAATTPVAPMAPATRAIRAPVAAASERPGWCGDGRVSGSEVCDTGVLWDSHCPEGWGMCWTCSPGCGAWASIATDLSYTNFPDSSWMLSAGPWTGGMETIWRGIGVSVGTPPPACSERRGDNVTRRTFDARGRMLSFAPAYGNAESWTWDERGRAATHVSQYGTERFVWDPLGRSVRREHARGGWELWEHDERGRLVHFVDHRQPSTDPPYQDHRTVFDARGRIVSVHRRGIGNNQQPEDFTLTYAYDDSVPGVLRRISGDTVETWHYDDVGVLRFERTPHDQTDTFERDAENRTVALDRHFAGNDRAQRHWTWAWGPFGITRETDSALRTTTTWTYDDAGALRSMDDGVFTESYTYDAAGRITQYVRTSRDPHRQATVGSATWRWSEDGRLLGGQVGVHTEEWAWQDRVLVSRRIADPWSGEVHYDYACLEPVLRAMPRLGFRPRPRAPTIDQIVANRAPPGTERNRSDPSQWFHL